MGIVMGAPYFKVRTAYEKAGGVALSSNYSLYADISSRMMSVIGQYSDRQEVYSIDESFLEWGGFGHFDLTAMSVRLRDQVRRWVGIPVGVGVGETRTLAKLANHLAKKHPDFQGDGICNLLMLSASARERYLSDIAVNDVWGIGRRWGAKFAGLGIRNALELSQVEPAWVRQYFGAVPERTALELRGVACLAMEALPPPRQQIICSRSFGQLLTALEPLRQAVSTYTARATEKLRQQGLQAGALAVFLHTPPFNPNEPQYHPSLTVRLVTPSQDTFVLGLAARRGLEQLYKRGYRYQKAGVMLLELTPLRTGPVSLFQENGTARSEGRSQLLQVMDTINREMGRGTLWTAAQGQARIERETRWRMKRERLSPAYTTRWEALPKVRAW